MRSRRLQRQMRYIEFCFPLTYLCTSLSSVAGWSDAKENVKSANNRQGHAFWSASRTCVAPSNTTMLQGHSPTALHRAVDALAAGPSSPQISGNCVNSPIFKRASAIHQSLIYGKTRLSGGRPRRLCMQCPTVASTKQERCEACQLESWQEMSSNTCQFEPTNRNEAHVPIRNSATSDSEMTADISDDDKNGVYCLSGRSRAVHRHTHHFSFGTHNHTLRSQRHDGLWR